MNKNITNWEWKKLGDVCDVKKGTSITKQKIQAGDIPVIAGGRQPAYYHNIANRTGKTITVSASGAYSGFVNYFEIPIFASDCTTIQSMDESKLLTKYVYLMLKSQQKKIYGLQTGAGQPHVYAKDLAKIEIPLPPLPTQRKIVSILERAEKLKTLRQEANDDTNTIIQALFYEMFGDPQSNPKNWETRTLLEVSKEKPKYGSGASAIAYDNKVRYIRITDVNDDGSLRYNSVASPSEIEDEYFLKKGDLLFARSGATVGKTYFHQEEGNDSIYAGYMIRFRFKEEVCNPVFVNAITKTKYYKNWLSSNQTQVAQPNINAQQYGSFKIILPPISLQTQFASLVGKIESIKEHQSQSTQEISTLFDALMQKVFSGELI